MRIAIPGARWCLLFGLIAAVALAACGSPGAGGTPASGTGAEVALREPTRQSEPAQQPSEATASVPVARATEQPAPIPSAMSRAAATTRGARKPAPVATVSRVAPDRVKPTVQARAGGTVRTVPVDGEALNGQDRVGAPGLGTFLFFDAHG